MDHGSEGKNRLTIPDDSTHCRVEAAHGDRAVAFLGMSHQEARLGRATWQEQCAAALSPGGEDSAANELERYASLLAEADIDLACIGIGENGHIAFNDPPVADFNDPKMVKVVELDEDCRKQQLGEGWFPTLDTVPTHAATLTVPAIMRCKSISCVVPDARKAQAVKNALEGPLGTACPASILKTHPDCGFWLDEESAGRL